MPADENNSSASNGRRLVRNPGPPPATEQEHIPCPRCDSTNTKFCYYNNYNYSQPRHFCKACRRYWTHGGTLRDIPIGGGTRKNAKRSRTTTSAGVSCTTTASSASVIGHDYPLTATPVLLPLQGTSVSYCGGGDVKGSSGNAGLGGGSFTSLLNTQNGPGFLALGGFGLGLEPGYVGEVGLGGLGRGVWGLTGLGDNGASVAANGGSGGGGNGIGNTWQFDNSGDTGTSFVGGDCFSWPDLAISTPGNGLKR